MSTRMEKINRRDILRKTAVCVLAICAGLLMTSQALAGATSAKNNITKEGSKPWSLVILPDTQEYSRLYPGLFHLQTQWILKNKDKYNIVYVLQNGDVVNSNIEIEWQRASRAFARLDGKVPYAISLGNHDFDAGGRTTLANQYFPVSRFEKWPTFGGVMETGKIDNTYHTFNAAGQDYLILCLEFGPRDEALDWGNKIIEKHASHKIIFMTHAYLYSDSTRYDWITKKDQQSANPHAYPIADTTINDGQEIWEKMVKKHHNSFMTISGHVFEGGLGFLTSTADHGNNVHQMLVNYQMLPIGGDAWLRILNFSPDEKTIRVETYSPLYEKFDTDPQNHFIIKIGTLQFDPLVLKLPDLWDFKKDPSDEGIQDRWFEKTVDNSWVKISTSKDWVSQAPGRGYHGAAWYHVSFDFPVEIKKDPGSRLYLYFGAVDGLADIYLDGVKIGEQKKDVGIMWDKPFSIPLPCDVDLKSTHHLMVRVTKDHSAAGIWKQVRIMAMDLSADSFSVNVGQGVLPGSCKHVVWDDDGNGPDAMVVVPGGWFAYQNAAPGSYIFVDSFQIAKYETTVSQYCQFLNAADPNGTYWVSGQEINRQGDPGNYYYKVQAGRENFPVRYVSFYDSEAYAAWRSSATGLTYRLPTEQEWEKAAGWDPVQEKLWTYGFQQDSISCPWANYINCYGTVLDVGSFDGTDGKQDAYSYYGSYDMSGNLWELTSSILSGSSRVLRGGYWGSDSPYCQVAHRNSTTPTNRYGSIGFRLVLDLN